MQKRKAKKPNPNDATLRNIRSLNKKVKSLRADFEALEKLYTIMNIDICQIARSLTSKGK